MFVGLLPEPEGGMEHGGVVEKGQPLGPGTAGEGVTRQTVQAVQ